jgi:hypothetical protein
MNRSELVRALFLAAAVLGLGVGLIRAARQQEKQRA